MDATALYALNLTCAPLVHPVDVQASVDVENHALPFAIGVVGGSLNRPPRSAAEALAAGHPLGAGGWDDSVGLAQAHRDRGHRLEPRAESVLDPCTPLRAMQAVPPDRTGRHRSPFGRHAVEHDGARVLSGWRAADVRRVVWAASRPGVGAALGHPWRPGVPPTVPADPPAPDSGSGPTADPAP